MKHVKLTSPVLILNMIVTNNSSQFCSNLIPERNPYAVTFAHACSNLLCIRIYFPLFLKIRAIFEHAMKFILITSCIGIISHMTPEAIML